MNINEDNDCSIAMPVEDAEIVDAHPVSSELETFRQKWKSEVAAKNKKTKKADVIPQRTQKQSHEKHPDAKSYFLQGIESERNGKMDVAIRAYKLAFQLDPEIEQRVGLMLELESSVSDEEPEHHIASTSNALMQKFSELSMSGGNDQDSKVVSTSRKPGIMHLPSELICYIFRWVASSHMDMKSIESLSETCRKFYVHARDQTIWKTACERIWGMHASRKGYANWRRMYIERPHVHLDGVYISKVTYFRQGDPTVMSPSYEPFQCVEYYRYLRFFENNKMLFYTTSDQPSVVVPKLHLANAKQHQFRLGHYKCHSEKQKKFKTVNITGILIETCDDKYSRQYFRRATKSEKQYILKETEYFVDLELTSTSSRKKFNKLSWLSYSCRFKYEDSHCSPISDISLRDQNPPFYFSKVKSYCKLSTSVL